MPPLPLATQSRPAEYAGERLFNYSYDPAENVTFGRSGLTAKYTLSGVVRAMTDMGGDLYSVAGGHLWKNGTAVGTVIDSEETTIARLASHVCVVAGGVYSVWNGSTLMRPTTGQVISPTSVATMDGYTIVSGSDTTRSDRFAISRLDDPKTFDGLDFKTAETQPDGIKRVIRDHKELAIIGSGTTERWYNSGDISLFSPNASAFAERGTKVAASVVRADNGLYWLGDDEQVYRSFGGSPEIISTPSIAEYLKGKEVISALSMDDRGRKFYVMRLRNAPSLAYSIGAGTWSEFSTGGAHGPWVGTAAHQFGSVQYIGTSTGKICTLFGWDDDGDVMCGEIDSQPLREKTNTVNEIEIVIDTGMGDIGRNRVVSLQMSRDGRNWSGSRLRDLGTQGEYRKTAQWAGCGSADSYYQAKFRITDPVQRDVHGARYG